MYPHIDEIEQFVEYFRDQKVMISLIQPLFYRKIIYATALDPIARAAFGQSSGAHRVRSIRLIDELTNWKDRDRVSIPQLCLALEEENHISGALYAEVKARLARWPSGEVLRLDSSPLLQELAQVANQSEQKIISSCRYAELFYTYRNNLIHEFREPGYGIDTFSNKEHPHYHSMIDKPWQLVFPVEFFARIYDEALTGLKKYLVQNNINPYSQFEFGSRWRKK